MSDAVLTVKACSYHYHLHCMYCTWCRMDCIQIWMCQHFYILSCELLRPAAWPLTGRSLNLLHKSPPFWTRVLVKACCETMPTLILNSYVNFLACGIFNSTQIYWYLGWMHSAQCAVDSERAHFANRSYSTHMVKRPVSKTTAMFLFSAVMSLCLGSQWKVFRKILYLELLRKCVHKFWSWLKCGGRGGHFIISLSHCYCCS